MVLFFAIFSTLALVGQGTAPLATAETVPAQGLTVSYNRGNNTNQFSFSAGKEMNVTRITVTRGDGGTFGTSTANRSLRINGAEVPTSQFIRVNDTTVSATLASPRKVSASDRIALSWLRGRPGSDAASAMDVKIEGTALQTPQNPPKRWTGSDSNGQFTMTATQGNNPEVTFSRTLDSDGTLTGSIQAWAAQKNGYDVDGAKAATLRISGPNGQVIHTMTGAPGYQGISPAQNWAGVSFALAQDIELQAGSRIDIEVPYASRATSADPSTQSPIGPGSFELNFKPKNTYNKPNQEAAVCNQLTARGDVLGFSLIPRSDSPREIREVEQVTFLNASTQQIIRINAGYKVDIGPEGVNDTVKVTFDRPLNNPNNYAMCAVIHFDADEDLTANPAANFTLAANRDVYPDRPDSVYRNTTIAPSSNWETPRVPNPTVPPKCGQNIAIVLDASNSVIVRNGVHAEADSARHIVEALTGTATSVGIYNFASQGNRFADARVSSTPLNDPAGRDRALRAIENYRSNMLHPSTLQSRGEGSTNWEGALKEIENHNTQNPAQKYDVVYFVTDGFPTYSDSHPIGGADDGSAGIVHVSDVSYARDAADRVKQQGTRIQPVLVNISRDFKEPVAKDSTAEYKNLDRYMQMYGKAPAHVILAWGAAVNATFVREQLDDQAIDVYGLEKDTLWGQGLGDVLASDTSPAKQPLPDKRRTQLDQQDWNTWAVGERTALQMGDVIAGRGDSVLAETFEDLDEVLSKVALADCAGSVTLSKTVVDPAGNTAEDAPLDGWEFSASTPQGNFLLDANGRRTAQTEGTTDKQGAVTFQMETDDPSMSPRVVIREQQKDGYSLFRQQSDGEEAFARCVAYYTDDRESREIPVRIHGDPKDQGFRIAVDAGAIITCSVINQEDPEDGYFRVDKVDEEGQPLEGSSFEVWRADASGVKPAGEAPIWRTGDEGKVRLEQGDYVLIEVKSPAGYALLPQPIAFRIGLDGVEQTIELAGAQGSNFVLESGPDTRRPELGLTGPGTYMQVANVTVGELPRTGGSGVWVVALSGLAIATAGAFLASRRKA